MGRKKGFIGRTPFLSERAVSFAGTTVCGDQFRV
jgi:hypothetical protein